MVAVDDNIYIQLINNTVHWVFTKNELPQWNDEDVNVINLTELGLAVPNVGQVFDGTSFAEVTYRPSISEARNASFEIIKSACENQILNGFNSSALGEIHHYPNNDRDQVNLSGSILRTTLPNTAPTDFYPFLCKDTNDVWDYRLHTAAQIQHVGVDSYNFILAQRTKNATLQYQISQATNQTELEAIQW